jgi:hypothetical protein
VTEVQVKQNQIRKGFLLAERFFKVTLGGMDILSPQCLKNQRIARFASRR